MAAEVITNLSFFQQVCATLIGVVVGFLFSLIPFLNIVKDAKTVAGHPRGSSIYLTPTQCRALVDGVKALQSKADP